MNVQSKTHEWSISHCAGVDQRNGSFKTDHLYSEKHGFVAEFTTKDAVVQKEVVDALNGLKKGPQ